MNINTYAPIVIVAIIWTISITGWLVRLFMKVQYLEKRSNECMGSRITAEGSIEKYLHRIDLAVQTMKNDIEWIKKNQEEVE